MAFQLKSIQQILGDMVATFLANSPINDLNKGSVITTFLQAAATEDFNQYFQMVNIIVNYALENVTGTDLDNRAIEYGLDGRTQPKKAYVPVTISDAAFTKVSTKIYAGLSGPVSGSTVIYVDDASTFTASGTLVIGRGTANVETINYSSITLGTNFDTINLSSLLAHDHGTDETVILSQGGDRVIGAGTIVKVPSTDYSDTILFSTDLEVTIQDGESSLEGVSVTALVAGTAANVPAGSINEFDTKPFVTATVVNSESVTNGVDLETDQELRDRIRNTILSLSKGTSKSIISGVVGLVDSTDNKRVISANLIDATDVTDIAQLIIDDGTGFEPSSEGRGFEEVIADATGGEEFLQLDLFPLVKATSTTINTEPYAILNNQTLIYEINNVEETVTFVNSDFNIPGSATTQEVVTAINNRATLVEARTVSGRTKVELKAKVNVNEGVTIKGGTANAVSILNFPVNTSETLKLYKFSNQTLSSLEKDGSTAVLESGSAQPYDFSAAPAYLDVQMDGEILSTGTATAGSGVNTLIDTDLSNRYALNSDLTIHDYVTFTSGANVGTTHKIASYTAGTNTITFTSGLTVTSGDTYQIDNVIRIFFSNVAAEDFLNPAAGLVTEVNAVINRRLKGVASATTSGTKVLLTSKTENSTNSRIKILGGTANSILSFSTTESVGTNKDYILNRFNGQIRLNSPLVAGDQITAGTRLSRGFLVSAYSQPFSLINGDTIDIIIDDQAVAQTITFSTGDFVSIAAATAAEVVAVINATLVGGLAEVTSSNQVLIRTNTFSSTLGSIEITAVTGNAVNLGFTEDTIVYSITPHYAAILSGNITSFNFVEDDKLVVVLDNDVLGKTFDIPMDLDGTVLLPGAPATTKFTANITSLSQNFTNKFLIDDSLVGMKVTWKTATNIANIGETRTISAYDATTGVITCSAVLPANITANDTFILIPVTVTNVVTYLNNTATSSFSLYGIAEAADEGTRVQLSTLTDGGAGYVNVTGGTANALTSLLTLDGTTAPNCVFVEEALWHVGMDVTVDDDDSGSTNTSISVVTPNDPTAGTYKLTVGAGMAGYTVAQNATVVRRNVLAFSTSAVQGLDSYKYYTGLLKRVQNTVDGLESDQAYPGIKAAGVQVEVKAPLVQELYFEIDVTLASGLSISTIIVDIKNAVSSYVNSLKVGDDVILSEIIKRIKSISGIDDVEITTPSANIAIQDGEVARVSDNSIIIG